MDFRQLSELFKSKSLPQYRLNQVFEGYYSKLVRDWASFTVLPQELRAELGEKVPFSLVTAVAAQESTHGDTRKVVFKLGDGALVEAVLMRSGDLTDSENEDAPLPTAADLQRKTRRTVCVSCQVGCPMGCTFCATGKMGLQRDMTAYEIVDQILYFARELQGKGEAVTNVVFMGMGEPMQNYEEVAKAIRLLHDPKGFNLGWRHISVSTCGIIPGIKRFAEDFPQVNLAVSLHAPTEALRSELMPANRWYPLAKLMPVCRDYVKRTNRKLFFEYLLIEGVNDSLEQARLLAELLDREKLFHVNLIKFHSIEHSGDSGRKRPSPGHRVSDQPFRQPSSEQIKCFQVELEKLGVHTTFRRSYGQDIAAACGQLVVRGGDV